MVYTIPWTRACVDGKVQCLHYRAAATARPLTADSNVNIRWESSCGGISTLAPATADYSMSVTKNVLSHATL